MKNKLQPQNRLERHVAKWINERAKEYNNGIEGVMSDLSHGCSSGIVGHLIYYHDTLAFYRKYRKEIDAMLVNMVEELDMQPTDLNGWDKSDPLARDTQNQNLLAWFGFEESARALADRAEIEY